MQLAEIRLELVKELDRISSPLGYVAFQRTLSREIMRTEEDKSYEAKRHRHLLRLIGDAMAWKLLDPHIIRELARGRTRPPYLGDQGESFDFVLDVAQEMAENGSLPIVADLTNLMAVGDIVCVSAEGVHVAECKNRVPPMRPPSGRIARQEQRGARAANYLTRGHVEAEDGLRRVSVDVVESEPAFTELRTCVEEATASERGSAVVEFGPRDLLFVIQPRGREPEGFLRGGMMPSVDLQKWEIPMIDGFSQAVDDPSPFRSNPYALPLKLEDRVAVAEGDLILVRLVDIGPLRLHEKELQGAAIDVIDEKNEVELKIKIDGVSYDMSNRFIENILWQFKSVQGVRRTLAQAATAFGQSIRSSGLGNAHDFASPTTPTVSSLIYRGVDSENPSPLVMSRLDQFPVKLAASESELDCLESSFGGAEDVVTIPMVIGQDDGVVVMRPATQEELDTLEFPLPIQQSDGASE